MEYEQLIKNFHDFARANGITEMVAVFDFRDQKTVTLHIETAGENTPFFDGIEQAMKDITGAVIDHFQKDWICKHCNATGEAETISIGPEGLEHVARCPICMSDKLDYI